MPSVSVEQGGPMRRFSVLTVLGVLMTASGAIGMAMGTASSPDTGAEDSVPGEFGYPEVSLLVDVAIQQVLVNAEDFDPLSEPRDAVLQAQL
jgi:hypothetical protein